MKKLNILFVMIDGGGNVPPIFGLIKQLIKRGHSIRVLGEPCLEQPVKDLNCEFVPFTDYFTRNDRKADFMQDHNATLLNNPVFERIIFGPAETVVEQTIRAAQSVKTDILMVDILLFPALIAGEFLGIPRMIVFHMPEYLPGANRPPGNMGLKPGTGMLTRLRDRLLGKMMVAKFNEFRPRLNKIRSNLRLPLLKDTVDLIHSADLRIIQTLESFDFPLKPAPQNVRYAGPVLDDPDWVQPDEWAPTRTGGERKPLILIAFSSTYQNQAQVIQNCIDALRGLAVDGLVTLGLAMEEVRFDVPENVQLIHSVRHSLVFPHADLVITHAGHGTVIRALASGVPLICLPMGRDQKDNAIKVEAKGCGIRLSPRSAPQKIRAAIEKILKNPDYKTNANKMRLEIKDSKGMEDVLVEIENSVV